MALDHLFDVLVIGSGASGLDVALTVAPHARVALLRKRPPQESSTFNAQGGIAAVLDHGDSLQSHVEDTIKAGGGLCDPQVVRFVVEHGHEAIDRLDSYGVSFDHRTSASDKDEYHLTREGGHSHRRVAHSADATGRAIETSMLDLAENHPNITVFGTHLAVDLIREKHWDGRLGRCVGAYVLDTEQGRVDTFRARRVVLATGGASKAYLYTSNPDGNTGDGIAMAWRAGCRVANMEFSQFHPTCLYHPEAKTFLITEAVRGEGGVLRLPDGSRFMDRFDERAELAPRDIVARAIDYEMKRLGVECVYLDISHESADFILEHFPTVHGKCLEHGIDMTREPIPVVPAAHYTCGGVMSDLRGRADVEGLYAVGEVAFTGLHGANRMASNSLLECLVFAHATATDIIETLPDVPQPPPAAPWDESWVTDSDEEVVVSHNWEELRRFMWDYVGIVRSDKRLERARRRIHLLLNEIDEYYGNFRVTDDLLELRNLTLVGSLIVRSAKRRRESRGLHYTLSYPKPDKSRSPEKTVLEPSGFEGPGW